MTLTPDEEVRLQERARRCAAQRARERRDALTLRVDVLDELYADPQLAPPLPTLPTIEDVAAFFRVDRGPLMTLVRHYNEELHTDGWQPNHPSKPRSDLWTEPAIIRAALLLDKAVGCKSLVADQICYHLGQGQLPLAFVTTEGRVAQCIGLYRKALNIVGDVHGDEGPETVWRSLQGTPRYELQALVVALAAMVPDDQPDVGRYLCEVAAGPGERGSRARGLALLIPQPTNLLHRRRSAGTPPESSEPGGVAASAER